jgi:uncharacterized protein YbaP (TraB family)
MKKPILLLLAFALVLNTAHAQNNSNKSLLWEVSGNGLTAPSYLFGTYHFAAKSLVDSLSDIKKYFNACKTVVGEVLMDSTEMEKLVDDMILPDTITLNKLYTADEYKFISDYVTGVTKMDMRALMHFKPATIQVMLLSYTMPKTFSGLNPAIDMYFQQEGKRRNNKVLGFETMKEQSDLLFGTPMNEQKKNLLESIRKKDEAKIEGEKLYSLYLQQDLDGIDKLITNALAKEKTPELSDKMLKDRNLRWITKIPAIMSEQPTFIVVGAAHLVGQYGLINQLRLKGYTVKPVKI